VILLQEHRLDIADCTRRFEQFNFLKGAVFWNEAIYLAREDSLVGGTAILFAPRLVDKLYEHGVIVQSRAQYITFMLTPTVKIGKLCIYGYSHTGPRSSLWQRIAEYSLPEAQWLVGGDFNFTESIKDKIGGRPTTSRGAREVDAWTNLIVKLRVLTSFTWESFATSMGENLPGTTAVLP
jgi:hypothetical protein